MCAVEYPLMISSVTGVWRAISRLQSSLGTSGQRMRLSNEILYLSHRLILYSKEMSVSTEIQRLQRCGNLLFTQELVFLDLTYIN